MWIPASKTDYGWNNNGVLGGLPQETSIVYQHNFDQANPYIGTSTYTRSGSVTINNAGTTVSEVGADVLPIGSGRWGGTESLTGAYFGGAIVNKLLYSEDFTHAEWVTSGTAAVSANTATDPMGGSAADTLSATDTTSYLKQDTATVGGSVVWIFSVWVKSTSGTLPIKIQVTDGTQGNMLQTNATTTWRRIWVPYTFMSSGANVGVRIYPGNTSNLRVWGAQLEYFTGTGRRVRWAVPNNYVRTTSAEATSGNPRLEVPNSILTQVATEGTIAFWYLQEIDAIDIDQNSPQYAFSMNAETFAVSFPARYGIIFWINGGIAAQTPMSGLDSVMYGKSPDRWTHLAFTWNTTTDVYKIYINGVDSTETTNAQSAINVGANTMNIGGYDPAVSYLAADGTLAQFVMWKKALSSTEIGLVMNQKQAIATRAEPSSGKIFEAELGNSPLPTTGDMEYYWNAKGGGTFFYPDSTTTLAASDTPNRFPAPCYPLNGFNKGGFCFVSQQTNYILQSEAITTTWAAVGAPVITAGVGTFLGTITYGTINGGAGTGIKQSVATAADTTEWTGSVYASVASGTLACQLLLGGDSGATPNTVTQNITLTTTPQRFSVYGNFAAGTTGNIRLQFLNNASGTSRVGGFMLERNNTGAGSSYNKVASNYIRTTTAAASNQWNQIHYRGSDSFNPRKGTMIAWGFLWDADITNDFVTANGPTLLAAPGQHANFYIHFGNADQQIFDYGNLNPATTYIGLGMTRGTWYQFGYTWDTTVSPSVFKTFKDGVETSSATSLTNRLLTNRKFIIGGDYVFASMDYWQGAIDHFEIWGSANETAITDNWNAMKAAYGR